MNPCPPLEQFQQLLANHLGSAEADVLERHVEGCILCQQALADLDGTYSKDARPDSLSTHHTPPIGDTGEDFLSRLEKQPPFEPWPAQGASSQAEASTRAAKELAAGAQIAQPVIAGYEILGPLGRGGMGVVYHARQQKLNRIVALKMVLPGADARPDELARFGVEVKAVARLQHPNIVQIYEVGEQEGQPFFTMEYVDGGSLARQLAGTPLPAQRAAQLTEVLARTVHYAHQRGIVHRDLKPANILLQRKSQSRVPNSEIPKPKSGPEGRGAISDFGSGISDMERGLADFDPKISDFGLAKILLAGGATQTQSGAILGTPSYMSPEQAAGRNREVGPAADIYALGAILYDMLTGRPPFRAETPLETVRQVVFEEPVIPRRLQPRLPRDLETICLKCLRKEPQKRYTSAQDLADDLERFLSDKPITARPAGLAERSWRWCRRNPVVATLLTSIGLLLVIGIAALVVGIVLLTSKEQEAVAARERAEANYQLARDAVEQYFLKITENPRLKQAGLRDLRKELLEEAGQFYTRFLRERGQEAGLEYELGRAHVYLAMVREELGTLTEAITEISRGRDILQGLADHNAREPAYRNQLAFAQNRIGLLFQKSGKLAEAREAYLQAASLYQQLVDEFPEEPLYQGGLATVAHNQGWLAQTQRQPVEAEKHYLRAIALQTALVETHPQRARLLQSIALSQSNLGTLYQEQFTGREVEAERPLQEALQLRQQLVDSDPRNPEFQADLARSYNNLAILHKTLKRTSEAERCYQRSLQLSEQLANQHRDAPQYQANFVVGLANLAVYYEEMNQVARAEQYQERALALQQQLAEAWPQFPEFRHRLAEFHGNRGSTYQQRGLWDKAEQEYLEGIKIVEQLAEAHAGVIDYPLSAATFYGDLGELRLMAGKPQAALRSYAKATERLEPIVKQNPKDVRASYQLIRMHEGTARSLSQLNKHSEALHAWDQVIQLASGPLQDSFRIGRAVTLARMHEPKKATAEVEHLLPKADSGTTFYNAACVYALCAATPGLESEQAAHYAAYAVELLETAVKRGYQNLESFKQDKDLDSLRERADFKRLLTKIEKALGTS